MIATTNELLSSRVAPIVRVDADVVGLVIVLIAGMLEEISKSSSWSIGDIIPGQRGDDRYDIVL